MLGLATGSTPVSAYAQLVEWHRKGDLDFSRVTSINLDEYCGLDGSSDQSYRYFMNQHLFSKVNIAAQNTHVPCGTAPDVEAECARYDALIERMGGIDLQLLGIGHNGHIGFNEPSDRLIPGTHCVQLGERAPFRPTRASFQTPARFRAKPLPWGSAPFCRPAGCCWWPATTRLIFCAVHSMARLRRRFRLRFFSSTPTWWLLQPAICKRNGKASEPEQARRLFL